MRQQLVKKLIRLVGLCALITALQPTAAFGRNTDSVGDVTSSFAGGNRCRGSKFRADESVTLLSYDLWMGNTLDDPLTFYVYEGATETGTYSLVRQIDPVVIGHEGTSPYWESTPPLYVALTAGNYYVVAACWNALTNVSYEGGFQINGESLAFGQHISGANLNNTYTPGVSSTWNTSANGYRARFHSAAGSPFAQTGTPASYGTLPSAHAYGNVYEVTQSGTLQAFDQRFEVTSAAPGTISANWYVYRCDSGASCNGGSNLWALEASGTTDFQSEPTTNTDRWLRVEDLHVELQAGSRYWIGYAGNADIDVDPNSFTTPVDPSWGNFIGLHRRMSATSLGDPETFSNVGASTAIPQYLLTIAARPTGEAGTDTSVHASARRYGNVFFATAGTFVREVAWEVDADYDGAAVIGIYRGSTRIGPYDTVWERTVEVESAPGSEWIESGLIDYEIQPGWYYLFAVAWDGGHTMSRFQTDQQGNIDFGTRDGSIEQVGSGLPTTFNVGAGDIVGPGFGGTRSIWNYRMTTCPGCADGDGDGYTALDDCNDADPTIFPGAVEVCDGADNNCDSTVDEGFDGDGDGHSACAGDCDDSDPGIGPGAAESCDALDTDCDGSIVDEFADTDTNGIPDCIDSDDDGDGDPDATDCDDTDPTVYTGAGEVCDRVDQDCDGDIVEGFSDFDGDLNPDCTDPDDDNDGDDDVDDCNDNDATVFNGATDVCDAIDQDCDGDLVEGFSDFDGDLNPDCADPDDDNDGDNDTSDCDDADDTVYTGAPEICDSIDQDCDGDVNESFSDFDNDGTIDCVDTDDDNDGDTDLSDCNDNDAAIYTGAPEICDTVDQDCDNDVVESFADFDNDQNPDCSDNDDDNDTDPDATDCNDADATVFNGAPETCDLIDQDCDGDLAESFADGDGDGTPDCVDGDNDNDGDPDASDCNDLYDTIYTGAPEICDAVDQDCDGDIAESFTDTDGDDNPDCSDPDDDNDGDPDGPDCNSTDGSIYNGAPEVCDLIDQDCDGSIVDSFSDFDGDGTPDCVDPDDDNDGDPDVTDCDDADDTIYTGAPDPCDVIDQDCDGSIIEGFANYDGDALPNCVDPDDDNDGDPDTSDCERRNELIYTGAPETCDGVDSDCDGSLVDGFSDFDGDGDPDCNDSDDDNDGDNDTTDCDDADDTMYTGAPEVCDLVDSDCDGSIIDEFGDSDGDGYPDCNDCDPGDPRMNGGQPEVCDGLDNDCDGEVDEGFTDADNDGVAACAGDCNDGDSAVYPGASEICDGRDSNCDSATGSEETDDDGDGYLACSLDAAASPPGGIFGGDDCDDSRDDTYPGANEMCDGRDNDCSGSVPATEIDSDADGVSTCKGDCNDSLPTVHPGAPARCDGYDNDCNGSLESGEVDQDGDDHFVCEYVQTGGNPAFGGSDCDDFSPTIHPGATETCDGLDNDCSGSVPALENDIDGDGARVCDGDCDDGDSDRYPGAPEICDGVDNDCSGDMGATEVDDDGDGLAECQGDCNDNDINSYPGATEICDGFDNDCDGELPTPESDADNDGYLSCEDDCDDSDRQIHPGAVERCNNRDDNCDGAVPDNEKDSDKDGFAQCDGDCDDSASGSHPGAQEICDGKDNDCNGVVPIDEKDLDSDGFSICEGDCNDDDDDSHPGAPEICDGADNNCDDSLPEIEADLDEDGWATCEGDCGDDEDAVYPGAAEICDGLDNDCNEETSDEAVCLAGVCGDGEMGGEEQCDDGDPKWFVGEMCNSKCYRVGCGDPDDSGGGPTATDALFVLRVAVGSSSCDPEVCDVNNSGGSVNASDALITLRKAVGSPIQLVCPEHS